MDWGEAILTLRQEHGEFVFLFVFCWSWGLNKEILKTKTPVQGFLSDIHRQGKAGLLC